MNPLDQLKLLLEKEYTSEDGEKYKAIPLPGLSGQKLDEFARQLPGSYVPDEIKELLKFSSGFKFDSLEEVSFIGLEQFDFEEFFPNSIQLAGDGFGNSWILDIDQKGVWGNVFYVCHDPAVIVKHSDNLAQFIEHIDDFGENGSSSHLDIIHEKIANDIWYESNGFTDIDSAKQSNNEALKRFALSLPENFVIADLRNQPNQSGFAWGKFGPNTETARRHTTELIWAIEKQEKKGFFQRLFNRK